MRSYFISLLWVSAGTLLLAGEAIAKIIGGGGAD